MSKQYFGLVHAEARRRASSACQTAPDGYIVTIAPATRSIEQNALLWSCLTDIARDVIWHGQKLTPENWKCILTASLKQQRVVPGIDSGFVVLGQSTSRMTKASCQNWSSWRMPLALIRMWPGHLLRWADFRANNAPYLDHRKGFKPLTNNDSLLYF